MRDRPAPPFEIIPVIDLKSGRAVRAAGGERAAYRPLSTPLCPDGEPLTAARGLLGLHPFSRLYIADLDAIEGGPPQHSVMKSIRAALPQMELWIDAGIHDAAALSRWRDRGLGRAVLGSESLSEPRLAGSADGILSLDFRGDVFLGSPELLSDADFWPETLIVMTLHSVGGRTGPDLAKLRQILRQAGSRRRVFAAGGVRGLFDLRLLMEAGVAGALIASALHDGRITGAEIASLG